MAGEVIRRDRLPWFTLAVAVLATIATALPGALIFDRAAIGDGQPWRLLTGNLVHYGWVHWFFDVGLFLILGRLLEWRAPWFTRWSLLALALLVTGSVWLFDPAMQRYAGLSGVSAGWIVFGALQGWQRRWTDWFWPAILALYIAELVEERFFGHGMVQFDDPAVKVALVAHLGGIVGGLLMWLAQQCGRRLSSVVSGCSPGGDASLSSGYIDSQLPPGTGVRIGPEDNDEKEGKTRLRSPV